jgi:hypothetical protein
MHQSLLHLLSLVVVVDYQGVSNGGRVSSQSGGVRPVYGADPIQVAYPVLSTGDQ